MDTYLKIRKFVDVKTGKVYITAQIDTTGMQYGLICIDTKKENLKVEEIKLRDRGMKIYWCKDEAETKPEKKVQAQGRNGRSFQMPSLQRVV